MPLPGLVPWLVLRRPLGGLILLRLLEWLGLVWGSRSLVLSLRLALWLVMELGV